MSTRMAGPSRLIAAAGAAAILAVSACAFASSTASIESDSSPLASIMVSESAAPLLSDVQSWWTGLIVMSMLFGTTIWSFVKFGPDECS